MEKMSNEQSYKSFSSFAISKVYKNESETSKPILNIKNPNNTSLKSHKQLNAKKTLFSLLEGENLLSGKFTLYTKNTNNTDYDFDLVDEIIDSEIDNDINNYNKKYQNEYDSSDISD